LRSVHVPVLILNGSTEVATQTVERLVKVIRTAARHP
jgi:hypothetical protein